MSLASIVSGIVQKESKVDRKKLAYFFKDYSNRIPKTFGLGMLLRILDPKDIVILNVQENFPFGEDNKIERIKTAVSVLLPKAELNVVNAYLFNGRKQEEIILPDGTPVDKEKLLSAELGLYIDIGGNLYVYKGFGVPANVSLYVDELDQEGLEELRDADLDVLLPTKNMWLVNELTRNREAEIMICYFGEQSKREVISKVTQLTSAILESSIKACLHTAHFSEDFKGWESEKESVQLFDTQYDFVLVVRGNRIDIHLPYDNGAVAKEPNGWLLLN